ncbi:MAG: hypothetical protein HY369_04320 [Candidatus Aenigmarchaeota archaeon]|nr:hypothetical protein [Candidatus Aenigmarchaeota archaeon]
MTAERRHFINLTNGLEWAAELPHFTFVRVESTAIEHKDWLRLLRDLDVHFLMSLALGYDCHFYDCTPGRRPSKTVTQGLPFIVETLNNLWLLGKPMEARTSEVQALKQKFLYVRRYSAARARSGGNDALYGSGRTSGGNERRIGDERGNPTMSQMFSDMAIMHARVAFHCLRRTHDCRDLSDEEVARRVAVDMADLFETRYGKVSKRKAATFIEALSRALLALLASELTTRAHQRGPTC